MLTEPVSLSPLIVRYRLVAHPTVPGLANTTMVEDVSRVPMSEIIHFCPEFIECKT